MAIKKKKLTYPEKIYVVANEDNPNYSSTFTNFDDFVESYDEGQEVAIFALSDIKTLRTNDAFLE